MPSLMRRSSACGFEGSVSWGVSCRVVGRYTTAFIGLSARGCLFCDCCANLWALFFRRFLSNLNNLCFCATLPFLFCYGNSGRLSLTSPYRFRCQFTSSLIAFLPSTLTGTARLSSLPLTIDLSKSRSVTGLLFW